MSRFHVHVYRLAEMFEWDGEADKPGDAMQLALEAAQQEGAVFSTPDNDLIALPFQLEDEPCPKNT